MHRILLLVFLAASFGSLKAQSVYTATHEGRTVYVFPYRLEGNWKNNTPEHRYFRSTSDLLDIPFSPVTLPDGQYIAYCPMPSPRFDKKNKRQYYLKADTIVVAARFQIRNNQKHGPAVFFDTRTFLDGRQLVSYKGRYEKDRKEGVWTQVSYNSYGMVIDSTHIPFRNNLIDGEVVRYSGNGKRYASIQYRDGMKHGLSNIYDENGKLKSYTTYLDDRRHGWSWDTSHVANKQHPYTQSNLRWYQNDMNTQEGRFIFNSPNRDFVRTVKMVDSIDLGDRKGWRRFQDSGIWYTENEIGGLLGFGSWPHEISPEYRNRESIRNKRFESKVVYGDGTESTVYFLGRARRVAAYEIDFKQQSGKQVHQTLEHIGYDSMYGNLFHMKRWEDGNLVSEVHYALSNFRATELRELSIRTTKDGNPRYEVETKPQYYTAVLKQPLPNLITTDSIQTYDKKGDLYYRLVRRVFISEDTVYLLTERLDFDKKRDERLRPLRMEVVANADSSFTLRQFAAFPEVPQLTELVAVSTKPKTSNRNIFLLEDVQLSHKTLLSELEYGFPDRTSTQLLLNGKPFTGGWNIHLNKRRIRYDRGGDEVEDLEDFKLVQIKRRFLPGYDTFIHVKAKGLPPWLNPRFNEDSDYPDRRKISHMKPEIYMQWMNGTLSGRVSAWDEESGRKVQADYAMGRKHGMEKFSWKNEHGQNEEFHNHYENGERVGNYTPPRNHSVHQVRPYRRNKPDGLHIIPGNDERQVSFFMRQGVPDLHIIQSEINTGWIRDSLALSNGIPNGYYRSYYTKLESNSGPDFDRMSEEEIMEYAGRNPVETAMPSTARMPKSEVYFNQGFADGKARFWFEKGGMKAEVTFRQLDSMQLFRLDHTKDGFELRALKAVEPRSNISNKYDRRLESYTISPSEYETGVPHDVSRRSLPWSLTARLPITLEYKNAMGYDEDGYSGRGREWLELSNSWTADYRYFFLNGQVSQEGRVENGRRTGWWIFNTESGKKLKEIEYTPGSILAPNGSGDTLHYKGRIKGYHPKGYLLYEGYVLDESFSYSCATETDLSFEDIWYTGFYDSLGNQTLQNNSGKVYDYHVNTVKRMEGFIRNGLYDSTWYQYSNGGTLESAGKYRNGKKNGRWLLGDLEGINFLDNQCFDAGDEWRMMQMANELDFTEEIWSDGKLIRTSTLNIKRDGSADDYSPASYEKKPWRWGKKRIRSIQERVLYRDHEEDDDDEFGHHRRRGFSGTPEF